MLGINGIWEYSDKWPGQLRKYFYKVQEYCVSQYSHGTSHFAGVNVVVSLLQDYRLNQTIAIYATRTLTWRRLALRLDFLRLRLASVIFKFGIEDSKLHVHLCTPIRPSLHLLWMVPFMFVAEMYWISISILVVQL